MSNKVRRGVVAVFLTCALVGLTAPTAWASDDAADDEGIVDAIVDVIEDLIGISIDPSGLEDDDDPDGDG